ncbi:MAG: DUF6624 domain-containing protein [Chitinophagaceae bacterium]
MRHLMFFLVLIILVFSCKVSSISTGEKQRLRVEIDSMYQADQSNATVKPVDSAVARYQRTIRSNFPLVKNIYEKYGYPGYDFIGRETSDQYFLLVQHSDFEPDFQRQVLRSMKEEVFKKNASGKSYAFLVDRVEINAGRPQIYGTQVNMSADTKIKPCVDTANLDKRRAKVGLEPIRTYLDQCNQVFRELNPSVR